MHPDDLEFLIAQYADGSLDPARVAAVEAVLRRDAAARAALASYRAVDAALAGVARWQPTPEVQWDRLAAATADRVATGAGSAAIAEDVEERLSRLSAGDASADERTAVEAALDHDAAGRLVLAEYASLDRVLATARSAPPPAVRWDVFAARTSAAIDAAADEAAAAHTIKLVQTAPAAANTDAANMVDRDVAAPAVMAREPRPAVLGRIGRVLAQPRRLAVAACLLVAASVSVRVALRGGGPGSPGGGQTIAPTPVDPVVPPPAIAVGPPVVPGGQAVVRVGPPPGVDSAVVSESLRDDVVSRPGSAMITSDKAAVRDAADKQDSSDTTALFPR